MKAHLLTLLTLLVFLALALPACTEQLPDCASPQVFCVGLVTTTEGLDDHAFNQAAWDDMQRAKTDGLVQYIAYIETLDSKDYAKNIDAFALDSYDLVITPGMGLREETLQAAELYPRAVFIGIDQVGEETRPNLAVVSFPEDQAGFLAGALAARLTKAGKVGAVCETSGIEANWRSCEGFRNGAAQIDPDVVVNIRYREDESREKLFLDTAWGEDAGLDLSFGGADVLFGVGGGTGQGALLAAAKDKVYAIGSERDQYYALPDARQALVTSMVKQPSPRVYELIRAASQGELTGGVHPGRIQVAPYRDFEMLLPEDVQQEMESLVQQLADGSLHTNVPAFFPR